jgi:lipopolysaccharide/colanic/teichoic acid biosynthesis glycosyltransferase
MESCAALVLLILAGPVILVAALLIKFTSRGPVFYTQRRLGQYGRPYTIYKLRSMRRDCEKQSGPRWSTEGDTRITPVGRFLRKAHIDELPQLWNVICGHMSLVGPRPERPEFVPQLADRFSHYCDRLLVRPGVTGLAQVQLPADSNLEGVRRKLAYDLYYVRERSPWLNVRLLFATALKVAGVSFPVMRQVLALPGSEAIEECYQLINEQEPIIAELP